MYKNTKAKYGIYPCNKYNFDESGFRISVGGAQWVITRVSEVAYSKQDKSRFCVVVNDRVYRKSRVPQRTA